MALDPVLLDDLTWQGITDAIRRRIPAASAGKWTLHAPVDPGVTLLELFAWLLEQRVYWLDQVPDSLLRAALQMLGVRPRPAAIASTVLAFDPTMFAAVPAGTGMDLAGRTPRLVFSTAQDTVLLPVERVEVFVDGEDRTLDLRHGRLFRLFPADGGSAGVTIVLRLTQALPASPPAAPFGLLFELDMAKSLVPSWWATAVDAPPPAVVTWQYPSSSTGRLTPFATVEDGTGGFRRSGVVRLPLPADWQAEAALPPTPGLFAYAIHIRVERATFTAPPRLAALAPNAAVARHQRLTRRYTLQRTWRPLPGNALALAVLPEGQPEKDYPPVEDSVKLRIRERDGVWYDWLATADLAFEGPDGRVFVVDRAHSVLRFGDGYNGRIPVPGNFDPNVDLQYRVGGGSEGNLGANRDWAGPQGLAATSPVPAEGGAEEQPPLDTLPTAASDLRKPTRAVTAEDYETLAKTTPGIAIRRARAAVGVHPCRACQVMPGAVTVYVVPDAPRQEENPDLYESAFVAAPSPDPGALAAVQSMLDAARLVTAEVFAAPPRYREVALTVSIEGDPADAAGMRRRIIQALRDFLDPLTGGDGRQGWPFGEPLRPSALMREAQRAATDGQVVSVAIGLDGNEPDQSCVDVPIGPHDLVYLASARVDLRRTVPLQGGLR